MQGGHIQLYQQNVQRRRKLQRDRTVWYVEHRLTYTADRTDAENCLHTSFILGLPPFTVCPPKNWTEAANRLYYTSLNFRKQPLGYAFFKVRVRARVGVRDRVRVRVRVRARVGVGVRVKG